MLLRREQRQRRFAQRLERPQPLTPVEAAFRRAQGAKRIGSGKAFEREAAEPASPPQILRAAITRAARRDEPLGIGRREPLDLAKPEAQGAGRTGHRAVL